MFKNGLPAAVFLLAATASPQTTVRVNLGPGGAQANERAYLASTANDGSIAYTSVATNLVSDDTNAARDVFVSTPQGATVRVSVSSSGAQGNGASGSPQAEGWPAISPNGQFVAFQSLATNLVASDTNGVEDVFLRDRLAGTTVRVSVASGGAQGNGQSGVMRGAVSSDGRYVVFVSRATNLVPGDTNAQQDVFVRDLGAGGTTTRINVGPGGAQANGESKTASITPDGRYVVYESFASNLVAVDTNAAEDVFLHDRQTGITELVSRTSTGGQIAGAHSGRACVSADGRYVAFRTSGAMVPGDTNGKSDVFVYDRTSATLQRVSVGAGGAQADGGTFGCGWSSISADGRLVAFSSDFTTLVTPDTNGAEDIFVHDRALAVTQRVSSSTAGVQGNANNLYPSLSPDGRYAGFVGGSTNLVAGDTNGWDDVFVRDRLCVVHAVEIASVDSSELAGNFGSYRARLSAEGRYVVFDSEASNLVLGDTNNATDLFVRDRVAGTTERVNLTSGGSQANASAAEPSISADGRFIAFSSAATNLVPGDGPALDVYVRDRAAGTTELASVGPAGNLESLTCEAPAISGDGRYVAFFGSGSLLPADTNGFVDVYVRDRVAGTLELVSVGAAGTAGNANSGDLANESPALSYDGRFVVFVSDASNLVAGDTNGQRDVFLRDRVAATTERVSVATSGAQSNATSGDLSISGDGRYVAFQSTATNLVDGDTNGAWDAFVRDRVAATTERVSVSSTGAQGNGPSDGFSTAISADGRYVAFTSNASNLVPDDSNGWQDAFVRDRVAGLTRRVAAVPGLAQPDSGSILPAMSADGRAVAFANESPNLAAGDVNGTFDVFVYSYFEPAIATLCEPGTGGILACPCGNPPSGPGRGCDNSASTGGARITASGLPCLDEDSVVLTTGDELATATSIVLQGAATIAGGATFGQGVRCVGGALLRLYTKAAVAGSIAAPDLGAGDLSISLRSAALGSAIQAGESRWYLVYYRDPVVLGGCPAASTFNATPTVWIDWGP